MIRHRSIARSVLSLALAVGTLSGCAVAAVGGLLAGGAVVAGSLSMKARLTQTALPRGGSGEVGLVVSIDALELRGPRPPLNAAIVLDRSGSMAGEKIRYAKAAAKTFVRGMREGDRVALITYSNDVERVLSSTRVDEGSQMRALAAIDAIEVGGMTNLSGGLVGGREEVLAHAGRGRVNRVVLISDGVANVGVTDPAGLSRLAEDLRERGVSLTSMGVGLDFNEDVMMRLADRGGGNYYYVRDPRRLAGVFRGELQSLAGIVAERPELVVELAPGVRVRDVAGYTFEQRGRQLRVRLTDIPGGARRKVVIGLDVPTAQTGVRPVADVRLGFRAAVEKTPRSLSASLRAEVTPDLAIAHRSVDVVALKEATRAEAGAAMGQAARLYERGDVRAAERFLEAQRATLRARGARYHFDDAKVEAELSRAAAAVRAAPAPAAEPGNHLRKKMKSAAQDLAR